MKKLLTIVMTLVMATALLAGCGSEKKDTSETGETEIYVETEEAGAAELVGGWNIADAAGAALSEDAQAAFDAASAEYVGMGLEPLCLMGTQVVAGTNYAIFCKGTTVTADPVVGLKVAIVYAGVDGTNEIRTVADFNLEDYLEDKENETEAGLAGGWTVNEEGEYALPADAQEAFDNVMAELVGVGYSPLAYIGSQVVSGTNYAVLCRATTVTAEPTSYLAVVAIYQDLEGKCEITSIAAVDIADFNE